MDDSMWWRLNSLGSCGRLLNALQLIHAGQVNELMTQETPALPYLLLVHHAFWLCAGKNGPFMLKRLRSNECVPDEDLDVAPARAWVASGPPVLPDAARSLHDLLADMNAAKADGDDLSALPFCAECGLMLESMDDFVCQTDVCGEVVCASCVTSRFPLVRDCYSCGTRDALKQLSPDLDADCNGEMAYMDDAQ
jgi:hypothetical protein